MLKEQLNVQEFHQTFGLDIGEFPNIPSKKTQDLRIKLIQEELDELKASFADRDIVGVADDIGDLLYVVLGTAVSCGIDIEPVFAEIQRSNMSKKGGYLREDGKLIKPNTYSPPNLKPILDEQTQRGYDN